MALGLDALRSLLRQTQSDVRTLRSEVAATRDEIGGLQGERSATVRAVGDVVRAMETRIMDRLADLEAMVSHRWDQQDK